MWWQRRVAAGLPITPGDLAHDLTDEPLFEKAGGVVFLIEAGRRAETCPASETLAALIIDAWQRREGIGLYDGLAAAREEGVLNLSGVSSRRSGREQIITLAAWLAELYTAARRLIEPVPETFPADVSGVGKLVFLVPDEMLELALIHETHADSNSEVGNRQLADLRRQRAEQLRAMLGEVRA